jgi:hypothetical protein
MKVYVLSDFDNVEKVDARELRRLIAANRIAAFKRADGWVNVDEGPIRGSGISGDYDGPERREIRQLPLEEIRGIQYCALTQKNACKAP